MAFRVRRSEESTMRVLVLPIAFGIILWVMYLAAKPRGE
jgi:hypothetical protein